MQFESFACTYISDPLTHSEIKKGLSSNVEHFMCPPNANINKRFRQL